MILTILCFIYTFWVTYSYGFYTAKLVCGKKGYIDFPPAYYCIAGFAILSAIGQYISLFLPLGFTAHTIIFLGAFIIIIFYYNDIYNDIYNGFLKLFENIINAPLSLKFIFIILVLWILLYASRTPRGYDFYLYHTQAIRWIEEYGIVPGLGNVHGRLAFNSSWFILQALFGFTFIFKEPLHFLNGFFFFLSLTLFWQGILDIYNKKMAINSLVKLLFFFVLLYLIRGVIHNLVDPILSLLILVVITLWFERKKDLNDLTIFFLFLFCSLAFTIKVSSAPIFLLPFICFIHMLRKMDYINIYKTLLISVLIILPFLIRNIIISGYLLYPFPYINLFSFDWKIPLSAVIAEKEWIYSWARIPLMHPHKVLSLSINEWLPLWFIARSFIDKLIVLVMIASFISFFVGIMRHKKTFQIFELQGVLAVGIGFWFITAPDLRFAYGFIFGFIILEIVGYEVFEYIDKLKMNSKLSGYLFAFLCLTGFIFASTEDNYYLLKNPLLIIYPANYRVFETKKVEINSLIYTIPYDLEEDQTGYSKLPSTPYPNNGLYLRGSSLKEGFRQEKNN